MIILAFDLLLVLGIDNFQFHDNKSTAFTDDSFKK